MKQIDKQPIPVMPSHKGNPSHYSWCYLRDASTRERHNHSHYVDRKLELQEFGDAVVDIATPHHCLDDACEVVICQNDVWGLFSHICACNALKEKKRSSGQSSV